MVKKICNQENKERVINKVNSEEDKYGNYTVNITLVKYSLVWT